MTRRAPIPRRDTMRVAVGIKAAQCIAALVFVTAFYLGPDAVLSLLKGGWG